MTHSCASAATGRHTRNLSAVYVAWCVISWPFMLMGGIVSVMELIYFHIPPKRHAPPVAVAVGILNGICFTLAYGNGSIHDGATAFEVWNLVGAFWYMLWLAGTILF